MNTIEILKFIVALCGVAYLAAGTARIIAGEQANGERKIALGLLMMMFAGY